MAGQPVWLCSVSYHPKGGTLGTARWSQADFALAERLAHAALRGVGNQDCERAFRMNITFCIHRAVSEQELALLPVDWECSSGSLAGGPVAVLWSRGIEHRASAMPCENPWHLVIDVNRSDLWIPEDCGKCGPCVARAQIAAGLSGRLTFTIETRAGHLVAVSRDTKIEIVLDKEALELRIKKLVAYGSNVDAEREALAEMHRCEEVTGR